MSHIILHGLISASPIILNHHDFSHLIAYRTIPRGMNAISHQSNPTLINNTTASVARGASNSTQNTHLMRNSVMPHTLPARVL